MSDGGVSSVLISLIGPFVAWLQSTRVATTVAESLLLTGALSAVHLIGFTLVMGGAFVSNLRLLGVLFGDRPILDVAGPAARGIALGLVVSGGTGLLLFAARASTAIANGFFQLKMALLMLAAVFQFTVHRAVARRAPAGRAGLVIAGACGLAVWFAVALAGSAFILLE